MTKTPPAWEHEIQDSWAPKDEQSLFYDGIERPPRAEDKVRRTQDGRPYVRALNEDGTVGEREVLYSRVTTYIKCVDDTSLLNDWTIRMILRGFAMKPKTYSAKVMQWQHSRTEMKKIAEDLKELGLEEDNAAIGTAVHAITERHDLGLDIPVLPEYYHDDLLAWMDVAQYFTFHRIEQAMINDELRTFGTPDRVAEYHPCATCGKSRFILDLKTGRVDNYTELQIAMQLGLYANSEFYDYRTGERTPHDDICRDKAIVVHLPAGGGKAFTLWSDIWSGWTVVTEVARRVREARLKKRLLVPFIPTEDIMKKIEAAGTRADLERLYHENRGNWNGLHTERARERWETLS